MTLSLWYCYISGIVRIHSRVKKNGVIDLTGNYINKKVNNLVRKYKTRNPIELLEVLGAVVGESSAYTRLKGYCFMSCQTIYVMFSSILSEEEKRIVAAHELGHIVLHRKQLKMAPMSDNRLYNMIDETEYQANLFAADFLISDEDVAELSKNEDLDYFSFCSSLYATPELMSFKLYSLMKRGAALQYAGRP